MQARASSIASRLSDLETRLTASTDTAHLDAQVLMTHILGKPRAWLLAHPEESLTLDQSNRLEAAVARLEHGEPLPYVLGHWEFYGLDFQVTPDVLIPRPETELLVDHALAWLAAHPDKRQVADIGTGSGCIAVSLAARLPGLSVLATDLSSSALKVASANAHKHSVEKQVTFLPADLLDIPPGLVFDLICANLPYIPIPILPSLAVYAHEPTLALDGGQDGLDLIRKLLSQAPPRLSSGGLILLEIEASQGAAAQEYARQNFKEAYVRVYPDLAGNDRLLEIQLPPF
jgi:release factor glutamine methyltransferase